MVLNSEELRTGLLKVYRSLTLGLTEDEWRAIRGLREQLEAGARRQCNDLLRDAELEKEIEAARDCGAGAAQQEGKTEPQTTK